MIRRLLVVVVVLAALLLVADRIAVRVAETVLADRLAGDLSTRPSVDVRGFPFLDQVVRGRYDDVRMSAPLVRRSGLQLADVSAQVTGADVPLSDAVSGRVTTVPVQRLTATAVIPYVELQRLAGEDVTLAADPGGVRVSGTLQVLGQRVAASAVSSVALQGQELVVTAGDLQVAGVPATGAVARALAGRLDLRIRLPTLPYDVQLSSVRTSQAGVVLSGSGRDVVLTR